jgi:hypothetical protein
VTLKQTPRFSIVMPTRNRGHVLPFALRSALAQTHDDYEIVVMANNPTDNTRQVVSEMADARIQYFETSHTLNMCDNWELAWTKARGEYVIYLCDDDALVPDALERIENNALHDRPPVVTWQDGIYYYADFQDEAVRNILLLFRYSDGGIEDRPAPVMLEEAASFTFGWNAPLPRMNNTAAQRSFFESWRAKLGRLFFPTAPDFSFVWIAAQVAESIRIIHRPLTLHGVSDHGNGMGVNKEGLRFLSEFPEGVMDAAPVRIPLAASHVAATFVNAGRALSLQGIRQPEISWPGYYVSLAEQLLAARDFTEDWPQFEAILLERSRAFSDEVGAKIAGILSVDSASQDKEPIRALRDRVARMAAGYSASLQERTAQYGGDELCAMCTLGMNHAALAGEGWKYVYIFGEHADFQDPFTASLVTSRYYDLLVQCGNKYARPL